MPSVPLHGDQRAVTEKDRVAVANAAIVVVVAGIVAAWFAAGSTGLLAHPLQRALTWLALAVVIVAGWPERREAFATWAILGGGVVLSLLMTMAASPVIGTLAVAVMLAAIAQVHRGLTSRVVLLAALAVAVLGLFRLACISIPTVWLAADAAGWVLGRLAGWLTGYPLEIGITFGGIDFLVLMAAIYAGWLVCTAPPRRSRAWYAAVAILAGQIVYLVVLAFSEKLLAALPAVVVAPISDVNRVGIWTWNASLRSLVPWNVPLVAVVAHAGIVAIMFRSSAWLPVIELTSEQARRLKEKEDKEEVPGSVLAADMLARFGPPLLAALIPVISVLGLCRADLKGKTIVVYEKGYLNWLKPEYDQQENGLYGMLPLFVESLGGRFVKSAELSENDLAQADVLLLIHPDEPWPKDTLHRIWDYVRRGGSLLVAAEQRIDEGDSHSSFNDVLQPTSMEVRYDTAVARMGNWEQSYEVMAHPAAVGIDDLRNRFGISLGASIHTRWPARPVLVGRWGWSTPGSDVASIGSALYNTGDLLGDLVLAAEQPLGQGRVFVLSDTSPLRNEELANAYPFTGRLLAYLANKPATPQTDWRQWLGIWAIGSLAALLAWRPVAWQVGLTSVVTALSLFCCTTASDQAGRVLPDGRSRTPNNVAYIDASHLEPFSSSLWANRGVGGFLRTLMRQGYVPLLLPEFTPERIQRAGLLVSIAPSREFSPAERAALRNFISAGGTFICMVGAEEAGAVAPMLTEDFGITVPGSPVLPGETVSEPKPLGSVYGLTEKDNRQVRFYAAWPVEVRPDAHSARTWVHWYDQAGDWPLVVSQSDQGGSVVVIGDTHFASNENLESANRSIPKNIRFWRWLLSRVVRGQKAWELPANLPDEEPADADAPEEADQGGNDGSRKVSPD